MTIVTICAIKTFSVLTGIDQFLLDLKDESDLGAVKADVCKLARAISDKTWNGDWDATVKQRVLQPEDK